MRTLVGVGLCVVVLVAVVLLVDRYAFAREEVRFDSAGVTLAGTLTRPRFSSAAPGVVLVHGSGERTRRSMGLFARVFAYRGYATLAYDKRGVGASEGAPDAWRRFDIDDLAGDATSAYRRLCAEDGVDPSRVGFLGVSQAGWVVPRAVEQSAQFGGPAFAILLSPSVSTIAEDRVFGRRARARHVGAGRSGAAEAAVLQELDHALTRTGDGEAEYFRTWDRLSQRPWFDAVFEPRERRPADDPFRRWERTVLGVDPEPVLERLDLPILWVFGDARFDRFSPVASSTRRVERLRGAGKDYTIVAIDGVDHDLELVDDGGLRNAWSVQLPLIRRTFAWLDDANR